MKPRITWSILLVTFAMTTSAQQRKSWNFYKGLSFETIANLNADTDNWGSNAQEEDGTTYNWKNVVKQSADGYLTANGQVIEELRGLRIDIGSNKDNSIHLQDVRANGTVGKMRLTRKDTKIHFPKLANGQTITIQGRSANRAATNRGIAPVQNYLKFLAEESSPQTDGNCIFLGHDETNPSIYYGEATTYTFKWKVETEATDSVDVTFTLTPEGGIDFYYFMIDGGDNENAADAPQIIVKGDMNGDNKLTISDAVSVVDVILGKTPMQVIDLGDYLSGVIEGKLTPYGVDNESIAGTWYAPEGWSFTLKEDGTTNFPGASTYKFRPYQGTLMFYNNSGQPIKTIVLNEVESSYLLAIDYATHAYTYYTKSTSLASGIILDQTSLSINSGTTAQLTASITPADAFTSITWTSSDESVATVDQNGLVTGVAGGTCTITAKTSGSNKTATCNVSVTQMVTSIVLSQTTAVLGLDEFVRLTATVLPENAANKNVTWSSSNEDVAPVRNGRVDAYGYGTATITCEAADGSGTKATCTICIVNPNTYVDLGLPSGTLWATCNVGATSPEEYGDYFAWGETTGYNDGKTTFDESTYKWCEGSFSNITKYSRITLS